MACTTALIQRGHLQHHQDDIALFWMFLLLSMFIHTSHFYNGMLMVFHVDHNERDKRATDLCEVLFLTGKDASGDLSNAVASIWR